MQNSNQILLRAMASVVLLILLTEPSIAKKKSAATQPEAQPAAAAQAPPTSQPATMRFKQFSIKDDQGFKDMEVFHGVMPADWNLKGDVIWRNDLATHQLFRIHWSDPQEVRAFDLYPSVTFIWSQAAASGRIQVHQGQNYSGFIVATTPNDQFQAFNIAILQMFRKDLANAKVIDREKLPDASKKIYDQLNTDPNSALEVAAGQETFEYQVNGQTVDELVSGVFEASISRVNNPGGVVYWKVDFASSRRAPQGQLPQLKPVESVIAQSLQINQAWLQKVNDYNQQRYQQALGAQRQQLANQQAWFNATEQRIASQSAANDAQHESYWAHSADLARQSENEADVQREVSPWQGGDGNTYKLPTAYGQAWQGSDGEIIMNNDAGYNPNSDPNQPSGTTWTQMQQTHN